MYLVKLSENAVEQAIEIVENEGDTVYDEASDEYIADAYEVRKKLCGYGDETFTLVQGDCRIEVIPSLATGFDGVESSDLPDGVEFVSEIEAGRGFVRNVQRWVAERERDGNVGRFDESRLASFED